MANKKYIKRIIDSLIMTFWFFTLLLILNNKIIINHEQSIPSSSLNEAISYASYNAKSYVVYSHRNKKILAGKNIDTKYPPASITKILTCITAISILNINDYVYINNQVNQAVGSKIYLENGDLIKIEDLLYGLILESGNDAALAIASAYSYNKDSSKLEEDFVIKMNELVSNLGLKNSIFRNTSGLDENNVNYTTARDMAIITSYALENSTFCKIFSCKKHTVNLSNGKTLYFNHKHRLVRNEQAFGGKTGYTKLAGRTLVSVFKTDNDYLIIVSLDAYNDWQMHLSLRDIYD